MNRLDELISRFLDDVLTPEERLELQHAIEVDPRGADQLQAYYQQDRLLSALLRASSADAVNAILAVVSAKDSFVDSVMRQAHAGAIESTLMHVPERKSDDPATEAKRLKQPAARPSHHWFDRLFPRPRWGFAVAAVVLIGLFVWLFPPVNHQPTLTVATGTRVTFERNGQSFPAQDGLKLLPGDLLKTTTNRATLITYGRENTRIIISPDTSLKILSWKKGKRFELWQGRIEATVAHQTTGRPMIWRTPQAEATVVGTELALEVATNTTTLEVVEGKVELTSTDNRQSIQLTNSQYAVAAPGIELKAERFPEGRGTILREYWLGVAGNNVGELTRHAKYPNNPTSREYVSRFAGPIDWAINYGERFRGYLHPPKTGFYTFWITARESAQLRLSSDESLDHAEMIASLHVSAPSDQWDTYPWQKSDPIKLQAGRKYYIEVLHKADDQRGGHCSVAWQPPGGKREVISGGFLAPFKLAVEKGTQ